MPELLDSEISSSDMASPELQELLADMVSPAINITPLVDVLLVLVCLLLLLAPLMRGTLSVSLPSATGAATSPTRDFQLQLQADGSLRGAGRPLALNDAVHAAKASGLPVVLAADKATPWNRVAQLFGALTAAGVTQVQLAVSPKR